jgi:DNA repair protein RadD
MPPRKKPTTKQTKKTSAGHSASSLSLATCPSKLPVRRSIQKTLEIIQKDLNEVLRPYQTYSVMACLHQLRGTLDWLLIELPTGAGKSWICVALAIACRRLAYFYKKELTRSLVLCPSGELSEQNFEKMASVGLEAGIVCAALKRRDYSADIIAGTYQTIGNSIDEILEHGPIGNLIIDEAHENYQVVYKIEKKLREKYPSLRVIGLTATPYTQASGYIYREYRGADNTWLQWGEDKCINPRFQKLCYRVTARELIEQGYLIPPHIGPINAAYDTSRLKQDKQSGKWTAESENAVFTGDDQSLTKAIIADFKAALKGHKSILIYCQNIQHMNEVLALMPKKQTRAIDGTTHATERAKSVSDFKKGKLKYLLSVGTLTRGFDAPRATAIVLLMASNSSNKFQQIVGRGTRLCPEINKTRFIILDYGQNIRRLCPDGDVFSAYVKVGKSVPTGELPVARFSCPQCHSEHEAQPIEVNFGQHINDYGFIVDDRTNTPLMDSSGFFIPGHLKPHCTTYVDDPDGKSQRCSFVWNPHRCDACHAVIPPLADNCSQCGKEYTPPALPKHLTANADILESPDVIRFADVLSLHYKKVFSKATGEPRLLVTINIKELPNRLLDNEGNEILDENKKETARLWLTPDPIRRPAQTAWEGFCQYVFGHVVDSVDAAEKLTPNNIPKSIEYTRKKNDSGWVDYFYTIHSYYEEPAEEFLIYHQQLEH